MWSWAGFRRQHSEQHPAGSDRGSPRARHGEAGAQLRAHWTRTPGGCCSRGVPAVPLAGEITVPKRLTAALPLRGGGSQHDTMRGEEGCAPGDKPEGGGEEDGAVFEVGFQPTGSDGLKGGDLLYLRVI